jgi:DNA-binding CsgD family transcriptional regulator
LLTGEEMKLLDVLGHAEIYSLRLNVGRQRLFVLFSSPEPGRIEREALMRGQMKCCYALSQVPQLLAASIAQDPLSDRERECLFWVSEGKTSDEVALILGVSANTVNGYITHAIQKFSASNRAMAIATAIRSGII